MKRSTGPLAVLFLVVGLHVSAAETTPHGALAERVDALRKGWSFGSQSDPKPPTPQPAAEVGQATGPSASAARSENAPRQFPRVNPAELLPRSWFGAGKPAAVDKRETKPDAAPSQQGSTGSARARLLRDVRQQKAGAAEDIVRRPQARAGSVLSPNAPQVALEAEATGAPTNTRLARSIAADVAQAMEQSTAGSAEEPQEVVEIEPIDDATVVEVPAEPTAPLVVEGTTPTETPEAERYEQGDPDNNDATKITVSETPSETTLPLYIGDRYSTVEASDPAPQDSFAAGPSAAAPSVESSDDLLLTQAMPVLVSKVSGPRTIVVGRQATYRVLLANRGDTGAERVVTRVTVPEWAEVTSVDTAAGVVDRTDSLADDGTLVWRAERLDAGQVVKLDIRLVARSGRPIELGVTHTHKPVDGRTLVEVQEPKLALSLVGPDEVLYGKPQLFRLTLANPGTGPAEQVTLYLTPPGGDAEGRRSHDFGTIAAGEQRSVEIELTAREAGQLAVAASAVADGGVTDEVTKEVFCRKAELVVDWRGPADRYAGASAVYYFRVRNPGTAVAPDVELSVELPAGFEVAENAETPRPNAGRLTYRVGSLRPGDDRYFELRGVMRQAGPNQITLRAAASDETRSERLTATTEVVALADLKLDVSDPKGPVATGEEIAYDIRVTNRGSNEARDVRVLGLFSHGIEPHHAEGTESAINDGRVAFATIDRLAAGEERVLTIHARAYEAGTHLFRAEVLCRDLDIKLAAEETTRFFNDEAIHVAGESLRENRRRVYSR